MRKILITLLVVFSFMLLAQSNALANDKPAISKGFKIGLSMSKASGADADRYGPAVYRKGLILGGYVGFNVSPAVTIQPELIYVMKGSESEGLFSSVTIEVNYLEVPLVCKIKIPSHARVVPYITFGPALAFKLTSKIVRESTADEELDNIKSTDFGLLVGGGLELVRSQTLSTSLDIRYTFGLSSAYDTEADYDFKNNNLSLTLGFSF